MENVDSLRMNASANMTGRAVVGQRERHEDMYRRRQRKRQLGAVKAECAEIVHRRLAFGSRLRLSDRLRATRAASVRQVPRRVLQRHLLRDEQQKRQQHVDEGARHSA